MLTTSSVTLLIVWGGLTTDFMITPDRLIHITMLDIHHIHTGIGTPHIHTGVGGAGGFGNYLSKPVCLQNCLSFGNVRSDTKE